MPVLRIVLFHPSLDEAAGKVNAPTSSGGLGVGNPAPGKIVRVNRPGYRPPLAALYRPENLVATGALDRLGVRKGVRPAASATLVGWRFAFLIDVVWVLRFQGITRHCSLSLTTKRVPYGKFKLAV
jgi:hypothetical protein